ncbi:hypothetical protein WN943_019211 [Citrus x changshan-huyou]
MNIRKPLHPKLDGGNKLRLPPACFSMSNEEKDVFLKVLKGVKVPDGYASNISRRVHTKERIIWGLKSHDNHILLQQLLPIAARRALPKKVVKKIFPLSFFDIMEHLPIHLAEEALIAGLVHFRWMYPIERELLDLKKYVRNRAHPEASIANGYLMAKCMNFCARYLNEVETKSNRPIRNDDGGNKFGHPFGKGVRVRLDDISWVQAHRYVLVNTEAVTQFREQHFAELVKQMPRSAIHHIQKVHNETFHIWFMNHVQTLQRTSNIALPEQIKILANGPDQFARRFKGCIVNGFRFRTKSNDKSKVTQNSSIVLKADTVSYASARDKNPRSGNVTFHGVLTDILEIRYTNDMKYVIFKGDWIDNQAEQVCYVQDPLDMNWHVVLKMKVRDVYDMYSKDFSRGPMLPQVELYAQQQLDDNIHMRDEEVGWIRDGVDALIVDKNVVDDDSPSDDDVDMEVVNDDDDVDN